MNEARGELGLGPVPGGDQPVIITPQGPVPLSGVGVAPGPAAKPVKKLRRFNPNHYGPGPQGGQFAPSDGGGDSGSSDATNTPAGSATPETQTAQIPPTFLFEEPPITVDPPFDEYPTDLTKPPGPDWQWGGQDAPGGPRGSWYNPKTQEWLRNDPDHPEPMGPHIDYKAPDGIEYRWFPDGRFIPKKP